jgi:hypothetical protein
VVWRRFLRFVQRWLWKPITILRGILVLAAALLLRGLVQAEWYLRSDSREFETTSPDANLTAALGSHVRHLSELIGFRSGAEQYDALESAARYVRTQLLATGLPLREQTFDVDGRLFRNFEVTAGRNRNGRLIIVTAHYDSDRHTPGADDNASGVAALIELAKRFASRPLPMPVRFVAVSTEEEPYFHTSDMGSYQ